MTGRDWICSDGCVFTGDPAEHAWEVHGRLLPRDLALHWLAERLDTARYPDGTHMVPLSCWGDIISAIRDAPGVTVTTAQWRDPGDPAEIHRGIAIQIPTAPSGQDIR